MVIKQDYESCLEIIWTVRSTCEEILNYFLVHLATCNNIYSQYLSYQYNQADHSDDDHAEKNRVSR